LSSAVDISRAEAAERIWHVLASHQGREHAITAAEIARRTGIGDEAGTTVRMVIAEVYEFFPAPVAALNRGFFLPETAEEFEHYDANLCSRLREMGRRLAIFRRKAAAAGYRREGRVYRPPPRKDTLF